MEKIVAFVIYDASGTPITDRYYNETVANKVAQKLSDDYDESHTVFKQTITLEHRKTFSPKS